MKILSNRIKKDVENRLLIMAGGSNISRSDVSKLLMVFDLLIVSKTHVSVDVIGVDCLVNQNGVLLQHGYWKSPMLESSIGYSTNPVHMKGREDATFSVAMNLVHLGYIPRELSHFSVSGVLDIECGAGVVHKVFDVGLFSVEEDSHVLYSELQRIREEMQSNATS
jgi:hypothetical protein